MNIYESKNSVKRVLQILACAAMVFVLLTGCAPAAPSATETPIATETEIAEADIDQSGLTATPAAVEEKWEIRTSEDSISDDFLDATGRLGVEVEIDFPRGEDDSFIYEAVGFDDGEKVSIIAGGYWKKVEGEYVRLQEFKGTVDGVECIEYRVNEDDKLPIMRFVLDENGNVVEVFVFDDLGQEFKFVPEANNNGVGVLASMVNLKGLPLVNREMADEWRADWSLGLDEVGNTVVFDEGGNAVWQFVENNWVRVAILPELPAGVANLLTGLENSFANEDDELVRYSVEGSSIFWQKGEGETAIEVMKYGEDGQMVISLPDGTEVRVNVDQVGTEERPVRDDRIAIWVDGKDEPQYFWTDWGNWVENEVKVSADGRVVYNEADLYSGLFTINPEESERLWREHVEGFYYINRVSKNTDLLNRFPTIELFMEFAENNGVIDKIRIPVQYPDRAQQFAHQGTWEVVNNVDLSQIKIGISLLSDELVQDYGYANTDYLLFQGQYGGVKVKKGSGGVLRFNYQKRQLVHDERNVLALKPSETIKHNLMSVNQLIRIFSFR